MASASPLLRRLSFLDQSVFRMKQLPPLRHSIQLSSPFQFRQDIPAFLIPLANTTFSNLQSFLSLLWDSILLAVPKHKTTYPKKRSRQLAGKALKDVKSLNHCSACGRIKRANFLCPYCVALNKALWKEGAENGTSLVEETSPYENETLGEKGAAASMSKAGNGTRNQKALSGPASKKPKPDPLQFPEPPSKR